MKKILFTFVLSLVLFVGVGKTETVAQDINMEIKKSETKKMQDLGFRFLKAFALDFSKNQEIVVSYVLTSGVSYLLKVNDCDLHVNILDTDKRVVASNYVREEKKCVNAIHLRCSKTGVYYIRFSLKAKNTDNSKGFMGLIGFKKNIATENKDNKDNTNTNNLTAIASTEKNSLKK